MSQTYIDEYLVKLGATVDASGVQRFKSALREVTSFVDNTAVRMAGSMLHAQTEIVGGFAAIGTAALGMIDKVAMADQEYRLFAMRMYMTKDAARSLKVAMDTLGQPLENLAWDPELRGRAQQLMMDQSRMAPSGDFDVQMRKVRDIRFEFQRMEVEAEYLGMHVVQDFMKALGMGPDDLLTKLRTFNSWVQDHLPEISRWLVNNFLPVWTDVKDVLIDTGEAMRQAVILFTNLVGLLSGDNSIEGSSLSMEKLATATHHVAAGFAHAALLIAHTEVMLSHLIQAAMQLAHGQFKSAWGELKAGGDSMTTQEWAEMMTGTFGLAFGGPMGGLAGATAANKFMEGDKNAIIEHDLGGYIQSILAANPSFSVSPDLVKAVMNAESGGKQYGPSGGILTSSTGALGIMQLMPSTASSLGVDPYDMSQNMTGGVALLSQLSRHYGGNIANIVGGYHEGQTKMDAVLAGKATLSDEARQEIAAVMRGMGRHGNVQVGSIVIHIDKPGAVNSDVAYKVRDTIRALQSTQRNLAQTQGTYGWSTP